MKNEQWGVAAAAASSLIGGLSIVTIRLVVGGTDPVLLALFRYGIGALCLAPLLVWRGVALPRLRDWPEILGLGALFFALFPTLLNLALVYTTASRGALALSSMPLLTLMLSTLTGAERLTARKLGGILIAIGGVALALGGSLDQGRWLGDLIMVTAALAGAVYNVAARRAIAKHGALGFTTFAMASGAFVLALILPLGGPLALRLPHDPVGWSAVAFLGVIGGALTFILWSEGLARTTPTRVAVTVALNPVSAMMAGAAWLGEPVGLALIGGLAAVAVGILVATR